MEEGWIPLILLTFSSKGNLKIVDYSNKVGNINGIKVSNFNL